MHSPKNKVYVFYDFAGTKVDPMAFIDRAFSYLGEDMFLVKQVGGKVTVVLN